MIDGRAAVIEHPHGENGIESRQRRQLLDAERQQVDTRILPGELLYGAELAQEQRGGVNAYRQPDFLAELRKSYERAELDESASQSDPLKQFRNNFV